MAEPKKVSEIDATTVVRQALESGLNRAVARVGELEKELRAARAEERRIRSELGRSPVDG